MVNRTFFPNRRNRRIALAAQHAFQYMTMASILAWRSTSRDNYIMVCDELRSSLTTLIARFFPDPLAFLETLIPWGALIVGEAALSHVLHDPTLCQTSFELAVGNLYFQPFLVCLSRLLPIDSRLDSVIVTPSPEGFAFHRHITRISEFRLLSGLIVVVYESSTPSACDVVAGYWTTALMNFVTGYSIGCAYPRLTFNNCTLLCDTRATTMRWSDRDLDARLAAHGFDSDYHPYDWPLYARGPHSSTFPVVHGCGRCLYVCPLQGRYFGDPGSLVLFSDALSVDRQCLRDLAVAPYGPMVAWRLPSTGSCPDSCLDKDPIIPPFIVSMLIQFTEDTSGFPRAQELLYTISDSDRRSPPVVSPPLHRRRRRYSV